MIRRQAIVGAVLAGWLAVAMSPEALAQPATRSGAAKSGAASSADPQVEQARQLYKDGVKEASHGNWQKAQALFAEAFKRRPHFQIAFSLGQAELKLGDYLPAAEHLAMFVREAEGVGAEERRQAREMLDAAERQVATLLIATEQSGVEVLVDGVSVGETPLKREVFMAPGRRVIQARREGYEPMTDVRTVNAGAYVQVKLALRKVGQVAAPGAASEAPAEGGASTGVIVGGIVLGSAGVATGAGLLVASQISHKDELTRASVYSFVAGGAIGLATLIYALAAPKAKASAAPAQASAKVTVAPVAGPGGAGVWATVRW